MRRCHAVSTEDVDHTIKAARQYIYKSLRAFNFGPDCMYTEKDELGRS